MGQLQHLVILSIRLCWAELCLESGDLILVCAWLGKQALLDAPCVFDSPQMDADGVDSGHGRDSTRVSAGKLSLQSRCQAKHGLTSVTITLYLVVKVKPICNIISLIW